MSRKYLDDTGVSYLWGKINSKKQNTLVSGTNIKTINNQSLLGSGNIAISGGGSSTDVKINGTSIVSDNSADIITNSEYDATTNKMATMSDINTTLSNALQSEEFMTFLSNLLSRSIDTTITSSATDNKIPSTKAVYDEIVKYIADEWDASKKYNNMSIVRYQGKIYICLASDGATVGSFLEEEWNDVSDSLKIADALMQLSTALSYKQDTLISGQNIKTINNQSIVGSGDVSIDVPTNNNQLINGAGYITGINANDVTTALGYTPYNGATNENKYATIKIVRW